ncbi:metalloprotease [Entomophthora muscae]|uniref:Metalloprotease n=1 Tax=Entomophthora muscae TaxID=34485 RepID=A0ACC2SSI3_9FUNG|nr:metalloprotease [Entomophthora muscae]
MPKSKGIHLQHHVIEFYNQYYSANLMNLVILGREPLHILKEMAISIFSQVPDKNITSPSIPGSPFAGNETIEVCVESVEPRNTMVLQFSLPSQKAYYRENPVMFITHFLKHEGHGSLMETLKRMGWATSLAMYSEDNFDFSILEVGFRLTYLGLKNRHIIAQLFLEYVRLIKDRGVTKEYFKEISLLHDLKFRFQEKGREDQYAELLARAMHSQSPFSTVLSNQVLLSRFNANIIKQVLNQLTAEKIRIGVTGNFSSYDQKETWYGARYKVSKLSGFEATGIQLMLPEINPYIPDKFDLIQTNSTITLLQNSSRGLLWYAGNPTTIPKASIRILLKGAIDNPSDKAQLGLFIQVIQHELFQCNARNAGLSYKVDSTGSNLILLFEGYSQHLEKFTVHILSRIKQLLLNEIQLNKYQQKVIRKIQAKQSANLLNQGSYYTKLALSTHVMAI